MSGRRDLCRAYRVAVHGLFIDRTLAAHRFVCGTRHPTDDRQTADL